MDNLLEYTDIYLYDIFENNHYCDINCCDFIEYDELSCEYLPLCIINGKCPDAI